ncbi:P-type DNA transfer protein VirB5 [Cupriavidus basilensis]|uniref:P-type DNA transfer protein VirB5 n=1 Tax=Cupriavidus basilensis TaxID=68895 RepID=UPI00283C5DE9|nr:P-type DNA transfer protein VirB5 [Cupriavidus basilensis]MDR3383932.1 P-type DNA transfer protein VirB5 [Cupriavidus basilensis]
MSRSKKIKCFIHYLLLVLGQAAGEQSFAQGIPVIDAASVAQQVQQVAAWAKQLQQMEQQVTQMKQQYDSLNGIRGMASLVNNPALRNYLPSEYQAMLNGSGLSPGISGSISSIRDAAKLVGVETTGLGAMSDARRAFVNAQNQNALNRAVGEEGYRQASQRFTAIQQLLDKVNAAPDQKDILDLQARIQAEQVMMQNEQIKLQTMAYLAQAQRDIQRQQAREISIKAARPVLPTGW